MIEAGDERLDRYDGEEYMGWSVVATVSCPHTPDSGEEWSEDDFAEQFGRVPESVEEANQLLDGYANWCRCNRCKVSEVTFYWNDEQVGEDFRAPVIGDPGFLEYWQPTDQVVIARHAQLS